MCIQKSINRHQLNPKGKGMKDFCTLDFKLFIQQLVEITTFNLLNGIFNHTERLKGKG